MDQFLYVNQRQYYRKFMHVFRLVSQITNTLENFNNYNFIARCKNCKNGISIYTAIS